MKIAGHTMGAPEYTLLEAIALFARLGYDAIEPIVHHEYRSALRPAARADVGEGELSQSGSRFLGSGSIHQEAA